MSACGNYAILSNDCYVLLFLLVEYEISLCRLINLSHNAQSCSIDIGQDHISTAFLLEDGTAMIADFDKSTRPLKLLQASSREINKPALSIAICSDQDAIAFGNANGIELHRKDFDTRPYVHHHIFQDYPAHFVQFLPLHAGLEPGTNIRLIGSSKWARPRPDPLDIRINTRSIALRRLPGTSQPENRTVMLTDGAINGVSLSDGSHFLSIDASSELLCLRLPFLRLFYLVPPDALSTYQAYEQYPGRRWGRKPPLTKIFAVARDLRGTVRVAAAYGSIIVLYSIPGDAFSSSPSSTRNYGNEEWIEWWSEVGRFWDLPVTRPGCLPYLVRGVLVGRLERVQALAIEVFGDLSGNGGLVVWGFAKKNRVVAWRYDGRRKPCSMATAGGGYKEPIMYKAEAFPLRRKSAMDGYRK